MDDHAAPQDDSAPRQRKPNRPGRRTTALQCKTCVSCRQRKNKCDGVQPRCGRCVNLGRDCTYPQDARSASKPTRAEIEQLESNIQSLRKIIAQNGSSTPDGSSFSPTLRQNNGFNQQPTSNGSSPVNEGALHHSGRSQPLTIAELAADPDAGPSPSEVHIAGAVRHGDAIKVHGVASMFHRQTSGTSDWSLPSPSRRARDEYNQVSQARLVAYASHQKQRETLIFRSPQISSRIDFDGVQPELALHLLDAHFNRQHYTYLISYRPAIIDSLINNGPYCNKILLNAIYLSSSIYSDRPELRANPNDPQSAGEHYYQRLRYLLVDHLDKPSIPTAAGLLFSSAILVSTGRVSEGWMHSGMAYRMITDLGCHLAVESRRTDLPEEMAVLTEIELEIRKRLYWGAFLTDATQSLYFGRPPTIQPAQARVPRLLLDTYEELELWYPYIDSSSSMPQVTGSFESRPAYAVSYFNAIVPLMVMSCRIVNELYSMQSLQRSAQAIRQTKEELELALEQWYRNLPPHLNWDPDKHPTFPPHQMTLLTTFHTLQILLRRPCIANGHLSKYFSPESRSTSERCSVDAALAIHRLVSSYRDTFTLRRAPYLISYAIYSAVVAVLNQTLVSRSELSNTVSFFWSALMDLRQGSNFGLAKPIEILREMMNQFQDEIPSLVNEEQRNVWNEIYSSAEVPNANIAVANPAVVEAQPPWNGDPSSYAFDATGWPVNDVLYGLFTPDVSLSGPIQP